MLFKKRCFNYEEDAYKYFEKCIWPHGPVCPHCGNTKRIYKIKANPKRRVRHGLHSCSSCKRQFTAKVGTIFEHARISMCHILMACYLLMSSKKGISSGQLARSLEVDYKTAWFLSHRIRQALRDDGLPQLFGEDGGTVEADETFVGHRNNTRVSQNVLSIVDRDKGSTRFFVIDTPSKGTITPILLGNISKDARLMTDRASYYQKLNAYFPKHQMVKHSAGEFVNAFDPSVHTNTVEGGFTMLKLGHEAVYQHWSTTHSERYVAEFAFRSNYHKTARGDDMWLMDRALMGTIGKRMTYKPTATSCESLIN